MNGTTIVGIGFCVVSLAIGVFGNHLLTTETSELKNAKVYEPADPVDRVVLVEGKVSGRNKILVQNLVHANRETYSAGVGSTRSRWSTQEQFNQPLSLDVGSEEVVVTTDRPIARGNHTKVLLDPTNKENRWSGIERGATVTVIGRITSKNPTAIDSSQTYADSRRGYEEDMGYGNRAFWITISVALLTGAAIAFYGIRRK